jgi:hypothetical protein
MDLKKTIDYIISDLRETRDIIDDLKNYPDVPLLQIELAKSKCKSAEELIVLLKNLEEIEPKESAPSANKSETCIVEDKVEELIEIDINEDTGTQIAEPEQPASNMQTGRTILSDRFRNNSGNINELIGIKKGDGDINSMLRSKPISNLADAIGINDKFYYVREIFKGNLASYEEAIKKLNLVEDIDDARAIIMSYTGDNEENTAILQLFELIKRKILTNE